MRYLRFQVKRAIRKIKYSKLLNETFPKIQDKRLWRGERRSYSKAGFIGVFCAFIPMPFQMLFSAVIAYKAKANIPLSVSLAWITNPLTMWPIWTGGYFFGAWAFGYKIISLKEQGELTLFEWAAVSLPDIWVPFVFGNLLLGVILGAFLALAIEFVPIKKLVKLK